MDDGILDELGDGIGDEAGAIDEEGDEEDKEKIPGVLDDDDAEDVEGVI